MISHDVVIVEYEMTSTRRDGCDWLDAELWHTLC